MSDETSPEYRPASADVAASIGPILLAIIPDMEARILDAFENADHAYAQSWWERDADKVMDALDDARRPGWSPDWSPLYAAAAMHACLIAGAPLTVPTVTAVASAGADRRIARTTSSPTADAVEPIPEKVKFFEIVWPSKV